LIGVETPGRLLKEVDVKDLLEQLDAVRDYLRDLTATFSKIANRQWRGTRDLALSPASDAEEMMKENLAASLILAIGVGVLIGYMMARRTE
jgi:hypothetical protein